MFSSKHHCAEVHPQRAVPGRLVIGVLLKPIYWLYKPYFNYFTVRDSYSDVIAKTICATMHCYCKRDHGVCMMMTWYLNPSLLVLSMCHLSPSPDKKWEGLREQKNPKLLLLVYWCGNMQSKMLEETEKQDNVLLQNRSTVIKVHWADYKGLWDCVYGTLSSDLTSVIQLDQRQSMLSGLPCNYKGLWSWKLSRKRMCQLIWVWIQQSITHQQWRSTNTGSHLWTATQHPIAETHTHHTS